MQQTRKENIVYFRPGDVGWKAGTTTSKPEPYDGRYTSDAIPITYTKTNVLITAYAKNGAVIKNNPRWNGYKTDGTVVNVDFATNPQIFTDSSGVSWVRYRIISILVDKIELSDFNGNIIQTYKAKYIE